NGGIISMATVLSDGASVEAATVGNEGLVGGSAFLAHTTTSPCEAIVQVGVPDKGALQMRVAGFRRVLEKSKAFHGGTAAFMGALYARTVRVTACNIRHSVQERCARALLAADDHLNGEPFRLSQEFLAVMLGVRRQAVSEVAGIFRRDRVI